MKLSDGKRLTAVDWRANRLVDALAKRAAATSRAPPAIIRLLDSATVAVRHAACLLACVTHHANNHRVEKISDDGSISYTVCRDAVSAPKGRKRKRDGAREPARLVCDVPTASASTDASPPEVHSIGARCTGSHMRPCKRHAGSRNTSARSSRLESERLDRQRVEEYVATAKRPVGELTPAERRAELLQRVKARRRD